MRFTLFRRVTFVCLCIFLMSTMVWSQSTTSGAIAGQVTDPSGAVIPGATITLIDTATNASFKTTSNAAGRYIIVNLPSGHYTLSVSQQGFTSSAVSNIEVTVGASLTYNVSLKIGSTKEVVTVEANNVAELNTTNATVGNTIDSRAIQFLPNLGRDVTTLSVLQPAVTPGGYVAGAVSDQNTYTIDGANNTDDMAGTTTTYQTNFTGTGGGQTNGTVSGVVPTPIESIEEVKVSVAGQGIDFNNSIGSSVQMQTKRGTNQFHGAAYEYYFSTTTGAANTWANNHTIINGAANPIVPNHRNRYGFALGGPMLPKMAGGKTYFFFNYEALNFPNFSSIERQTPTAELRAGIVTEPNLQGVQTRYNLNPTTVTVNNIAYAPATCGTTAAPVACDPRGLGLNSIVNQIWTKYMPLPNDFTGASGDIYNTAGYLSSVRAKQHSTFMVGRVDHDFGDKHRFFSSYRYFAFQSLTTNQLDIGGYFSGDTLGNPVATAPRPQKPSLFSAGVTSTLSSNWTNTFNFGYTRNWWQWGVQEPTGGQLPGMGGMLEIGGETAGANALIPFNVNTQSTRQRFWDGQDKLYKDDLTWIKGNHLYQFGFSYQRDNDYHSRTDNGAGQNNQVVYQSNLLGLNWAGYYPTTIQAGSQTAYAGLAAEVLGAVSQSQVVFARQGANLSLLPVGSAATDRSIIPFYNAYWGDTWHVRPGLTLVYGLAYALELPPYELNGKQIMAVDQAGNLISGSDYLASKKSMALQGQTYNPLIGFSLVGNVGQGIKYPYHTVYGEFSPRAAFAWNPSFHDGIMGKIFGDGKTVVRGSYGRIYGRLNGVDQVLVPLLGPGFLQASSCANALSNGTCGATSPNPTNVFRIGTDGLTAPLVTPSATLSQPYFPGVNGNANGGDINTLDPNFKPSRSDNFTFSIQRQINHKMSVDLGYIGRIDKHDFQEINLDAVPFMYTLGGQTFANAYAQSYLAACGLTTACNGGVTPSASIIPVQPFFEAAMGGKSSAACAAFTSCTAALFSNSTAFSALQKTSPTSIWNYASGLSSWVPGKTTISQNGQANSIALSTSLGFSNYNALYISYRISDYHGLTLQSNFTWSKALGTGPYTQATSSNTALNPWDMNAQYGQEPFNYPFLYNLIMYYQPPFFKSQKGIIGHLLGGWTISPLFQAQSGAPFGASFAKVSGSQAFGEIANTATAISYAEYAVITGPVPQPTRYLNTNGTAVGTAAANPTGQNAWANPAQVLSSFRPCILGYDTSCGGEGGQLHDLPAWNMDATVAKRFFILPEGRLDGQLIFSITNVFNHLNPSITNATITSPTTFGRVASTQLSSPRSIEFGLRFGF